MSDAPERIWASSDWKRIDQGKWWDGNPGGDSEEYVRADRIEELERERDEWKSRYEHHNHERLETLNLNAMQASKIGSLMNKIATLEKEIKDLRGKE